MALSPAHRWGQIIGNILEEAIRSHLQLFADEHGLYLDKRGKRSVRGKKQKATWEDTYHNFHDLDFVLERGGSDTEIGVPVAFVESAWRRYTKHSRNKAQEIQGAILPITDAYKDAAPRKAAVLAGVFTNDSIRQMRSLGFHVALIDRPTVVGAFKSVDIDADYDEHTDDADAQLKVDRWKALSKANKARVVNAISEILSPKMKELNDELVTALGRQIASVHVLPLHGTFADCPTVASAIDFIREYPDDALAYPVARYEIQIRYNNGDRVDGQFKDKGSAIHFLETFHLSVTQKLKALQAKLEQSAELPI